MIFGIPKFSMFLIPILNLDSQNSKWRIQYGGFVEKRILNTMQVFIAQNNTK